MARTLRDQARAELEAQARSGFRAPDIVAPNPANYGIFGAGYAGALQQHSADPYFGGATRATLQALADNENTNYERELAATRDAQLKAQHTAGYYGILGDVLSKEPDGLIGMRSVGQNPDGTYGILNDPVLAAASNAVALDSETAENFNKRAAGVKNVADAGFAPTPSDLSQLLRNPLESPDSAVQYGVYATPADATARYAADEGLTFEQQLALEEAKALYKSMYPTEDPNKVEWSQEINPITGVVEWKAKGTRAGLEQDGLAPPGTPRPNAGVQAPGTSATTGSAFFSNPNSRAGMRTDPITGQRREHKGEDFAKPLGTAIPAEQDGEVVFSGPMRGFGPHTLVLRYADGSEVLYGHNRASVPVGTRVRAGDKIGEVGSEGRSTGPHVHRQVRRGPQQRPQTQVAEPNAPPVRLDRITSIIRRAQERGGKIEQVGDTIVITAPDGQKRVYDANGNVING